MSGNDTHADTPCVRCGCTREEHDRGKAVGRAAWAERQHGCAEFQGSDTHADTIERACQAAGGEGCGCSYEPYDTGGVTFKRWLCERQDAVTIRDEAIVKAAIAVDTYGRENVKAYAALDELVRARGDALRWAKAERAGRKRERARADQAEAALDTLLVWTEEHLDGLTPPDEMDDDDENIVTSLRCIVQGEEACTTEEDYSPAQWQALQTIKSRRAALSAGSGGRETNHTCPCGYSGPEECNGCPGGCKRRPAGVTGWDHIDRAGGR